ncbi:MAG: DUF4168 domain-containing protein [Balneolales bacterium]
MRNLWMAGFVTAFLFIFTAVSAQGQFQQVPPDQAEEIPEVTDDELQVFVDASMQAQQIQMESQMEMIAIVEEEGLDVETYNEILQSRQMGQSDDEIEVESEEIEKFETASELVGAIEQEMEGKLISAIEEEGLELDRFQQIFVAIQSSPELQQKMQQMIQETQMQQEGQPGN